MRGDADFERYVAARWSSLVRVGWLLTGDWAAAEDLVQSALTRSWTRWPLIRSQQDPEAYVRKVMLTTYLDGKRRRSSSELVTAALPERPTSGDLGRAVEDRTDLAVALAELPPRQRAVVVLRYLDDQSEAEVARVLRCSPGTVKSQSSKALARLRSSRHLLGTTEEGRS